MQRTNFASRSSFAGLFLVFFALMSLALWSTTTTQGVIERTKATVLLSDDYQNAARAIENEATIEREYRLAPSAVAAAAQWSAADGTVDALLQIEKDGDAPDRQIAKTALAEHAAYQEATSFLFAAIDAGDSGLAALLDLHSVDPLFERIARDVEKRSAALHQRALQSLTRLTQTQRMVQNTTLLVLTFGVVCLATCAIVLRSYRRRLDAALAAEIGQLSRAALTDNLTRLGNQRAFEDALRCGIHQARSTGQALTLALVDVDKFKEINDRNGHPFGDRVLAMVGSLLASIRAGDRISAFRIGGDEFAIVLPDMPLDDAVAVISRLRDNCAAERLQATLSIGLATLTEHCTDMKSLQAHADAALYEAKRRGRNTVATFDQVSAAAPPALAAG